MSYQLNLIKGLLILSLSFLSHHTVNAQWQPTGGPEGGPFGFTLEVNDTLFVSVGSGGILRSTDYGETWQPVNTGLPENISANELKESGGVVYASLSEFGLYKSEDMGDNWSSINSGIEEINIYKIGINNNEIYAGNVNGGVFYSSDGGTSWVDKGNELATLQVQSFTFHNDEIYAAVYDKLYKSSNKGDSWQEVTINNLNANGIQAIGSFNNTIYLTTAPDLLISSDNGSTWDKVNPFDFNYIRNMHSTGDSVYMVNNAGTILITTNNGVGWSSIVYPGSFTSVGWDVLITQGKLFISSLLGGLYSSSDNGITWSTSFKGVASLTINSLITHKSYIFASTQSQGLFRSNDSGTVWESANAGITNATDLKKILAVDTLLFTANNKLYKSNDDGITWSMIYDPSDPNTYIQTFDFDNGLMAMGVNGIGIYVSEDTAQTWTLTSTTNLGEGEGYRSIDIKGDSIVVGTENGNIYTTTDKGNNWSHVSIANVFYIGDIKFVNSTLITSTYGTVLKSEDLGQSWSSLTDGLEGSGFLDIYEFGDHIYLASDNGIYSMVKGEDTWKSKSEGWTNNNFARSIVSDGENMFAGTLTSSVWSSSLGYINNTVPEITGTASQLSTPEETIFTLQISDLVIEDPDVSSFDNYTIEVYSGDNYSFNGSEITPDVDFNGTLTVSITVNDGYDTSEPFEISIEVTPVNDAPVITSAVDGLKTFLATPITIRVTDLEITDPDNSLGDISINAQAGTNYTADGATITPNEGFEGIISVPVIANDGTDDSEPFNIDIEVSITAGIENNRLSKQIEIYPNPASNKLSIKSNVVQNQIKVVRVIDLSGNTLIKKSLTGTIVSTLNISGLSKGIYFLVFESKDAFGVKRFVKK